jgi:hypothetical protein
MAGMNNYEKMFFGSGVSAGSMNSYVSGSNQALPQNLR